MTRTRSILLFATTVLFATAPQFAQTPAKPSFDVVSIKPTAPGQRGGGGGVRGDKYTVSNITLKLLVQTAYQRPSTGGPVAQLQMIGAPPWMDSDRYDVQATADCSSGPVSREQLQLMVRSLVEERFQLKAHMETRELAIYNLVVAKDGPKIKRSRGSDAGYADTGAATSALRSATASSNESADSVNPSRPARKPFRSSLAGPSWIHGRNVQPVDDHASGIGRNAYEHDRYDATTSRTTRDRQNRIERSV